MKLPKPYLSYSQYALWKSSKDGYRKRYYLNEKPFENRETLFGKAIGTTVENNLHKEDEILSQLIDYPIKEHKIEVEYKGLNMLGYLDQFDDTEYRILEMKTGHLSPKGKSPWDNMKVRKHKQLTFYSALVELKYGKVHPEVILQWLETKFEDKVMEFDGHILKADKGELKLTGRLQTFKRIIHPWERKMILKDILQVAKEISQDYERFRNKKTNEPPRETVTQEEAQK